MRVMLLVIAAAGCGRVDFDPRADAVSDAGIPTAYYTVSGDSTNPNHLFQIDLVTGQLTLLADIPLSLGTLTGLAYWDANTFYGASYPPNGGTLVEIKLSPFSATAVQTNIGYVSALEHHGSMLVGMEENSGRFVTWTPGSALDMAAQPLPAGPRGGDLAHCSDGNWYWYTNSNKQLYQVDIVAGTATAVGAPAAGAAFTTGLICDDANELFLITSEIVPISKATGQLGAAVPACVNCPSAFGLSSGDATRTPN